MKITQEVPIEVEVFRSSLDGRIVVDIQQDGPADETTIRVTLNDVNIFDGDTETDSMLDMAVAESIADALEQNWESGDLAGAVQQAISFLRGGA